MLRQNLNQKLLQKLSPQQIQLMKLLQIPTATLEQRIKEELEANPALDEGEDYDDVDTVRDEDDLYDNNFGNATTDNENGDDYKEDYVEEPKTKEEAILMMADSIEAASKSLKNPDEEAINNLVEGIIAGKIKQNQFR